MKINTKHKTTVVRFYLCSLLFALIFLSCSKSNGYKKKLNVDYKNIEPRKLEVVEFNRALFAIDTANFEEGYRAIIPQFSAFLIEEPDEEEIMYMKEFVTDTFMLKINKLVCETFPDKTIVANELKGVFQHFRYYYPDYSVPPVYTYVSGVYYNRPNSISNDYALIGLDFYLSNKDLVYDVIGFPRYVSRRCQPAYLTKNLAEELYYNKFGSKKNRQSLLAEMIEQGKMYYFIEAMNPALPDSVILGYTASQMKWADDNEGDVWAAVVGNNILYSNALEQRRMLFNDGPFTAAFNNEAPARLGDFLGLHIVRAYMSHNDVTLQNLMEDTDYQDIFQRSQYKPRK